MNNAVKIIEDGFAQKPDYAKFNKRPTAAIHRYDELLRSHSALQAFAFDRRLTVSSSQASELRQTIRCAGS